MPRTLLVLSLSACSCLGAPMEPPGPAPDPSTPELVRAPASPVPAAAPSVSEAPTSEAPAPAVPSTNAPVREAVRAPVEPSHPCLERAQIHAASLAREPRSPDELPLVEPGASFSVHYVPDLDGDGICDLDLTPSSGAWNKVWPHLLYTSRECVWAGGLIEAELTVVQSVGPAGLRDIEGSSALSCAGGEFVWSRYAFEDGEYREAESLTCCFCDEDPCEPNPPGCEQLRTRQRGAAVEQRCSMN